MQTSALLDRHGVSHGFGDRTDGVSEGPFANANAGLRNGDTPEAVAENRRRFAARLGVARDRLTTVRQVHGSRVGIIQEPADAEGVEADALVTGASDCLVAVTTADCVPILLADPKAGVVAAVHAGWRSAHGEIIPRTVDAMRTLGAMPDRLVAAIGPAIRQDSYEVDPPFREAWLQKDPATDRFFQPAPRADRWFFDLPACCGDALKAAGILAIDDLGLDTFVAASTYFSYRRSRQAAATRYGVQLSGILAPG